VPEILLGTHTYPASGDAARRQEDGVASLRRLHGVQLANVQFSDTPHHVDGLRTLTSLTRDSRTITGRAGPRKPLVSDIFDALWRDAESRGADYFAFANADIHISQEAVDRIAVADRDGYIFAREDYDASSRQPRGLNLYGADAFAIATRWWARHRRRFRGYILGEAVWDNVYAAVVSCHGRAAFENRRAFVRHEAHGPNWTTAGPFADYQQLLAACDAAYFSLWCQYVDRLLAMRTQGASADAEDDLVRRTFLWPPPLRIRVRQRVRHVNAIVRYAALRLRG
jgi:hypothetical protein